MTKKLYLEDPYVTSFEAEILETRDLPEGTALVLDATHFYPESGGQPYDLGTIDGIAVTKVLESEDDTILHFVEKRPESAQVHCEVDSARRRDHMQQHSGQHVLSAAFVREAGAETTSFHLGARVSTIDLDKFPLSDEELHTAARPTNLAMRPIHDVLLSFGRGARRWIRAGARGGGGGSRSAAVR